MAVAVVLSSVGGTPAPAAAAPAAATAPSSPATTTSGHPAGDYLLSTTVSGPAGSVGMIEQFLAGTSTPLRVATFHASPTGLAVQADVRTSGPSDSFAVVGAAQTAPITLKSASWGIVTRGTAFTSPTSANLVWHGVNASPDIASYLNIPLLYSTTRARIVRIAVSECEYLPFFTSAYEASYAQRIATAVSQATSNGGAAIIALMTSCHDNATSPAQPAQATEAGPDMHAVAFWSAIAKQFAGNPSVMFELYNEPQMGPKDSEPGGTTGLSVWRNGGTLSAGAFTWQTPGMQALYNAVRGAGANNAVLVDGLSWASNLTAAASDPIDGTNIAYAFHVYGPGTAYPASLNTQVAPVMTGTGAFATIATEFGTTVAGAGGSQYLQSCVSWIEAHGDSWMVWGWYTTGYDSYALLQNWPKAVSSRGYTIEAAF